MSVAARHGVRLIYRSVQKKRYGEWLTKVFGQGVFINPHVTAFALLSACVNDYLLSLPGKPRGMFISDENKQVMADVEKSIKVLKGEVGTIRLGQVIEKGFFIDSSKSRPLQLCDLFALSLRKSQERKLKMSPPKTIDDSGIQLAEALVHENYSKDADVLTWLRAQNQKPLPAAPPAGNPGPESAKKAARGRNPGSIDIGP